MTLSCEQCIDIVAICSEIKRQYEHLYFGGSITSTVERNDTIIDFKIEDDEITILRVFVQNQESKKLADLLTDYFNEEVS